MKAVVAAFSASLLLATAGVCQTPAEQYAAVFREYSPASGGMRNASTDLGRKEAVARLGSFAPKFLALAEQYPDDPAALKALRQAVQVVVTRDSGALITWQTNRVHFPTDVGDGSASKTVALVLGNHRLSDQLAPVIDRMRYGYRLDYEKALRTVLEGNLHREIQGLACLSLAQFLNDKLRMVQLSDDRSELIDRYAAVFGDDYLPELQRLRQEGLAARIESLFELAAAEYADVKFRDGTVGETAKLELYEIRNLAIGKTAPEIEGQDQDAVQFKLSDYRGEVVLLYFWSEL